MHRKQACRNGIPNNQIPLPRKPARMGHPSMFESRYILENDTSLVAPLIARIEEQITARGLFDELQLARIAVALNESLTNAINHGNLELDSELRQQNEQIYLRLGEVRRHQDPYACRRVKVVATLAPSHVQFVVRDDGPGFDPQSTRNPTDEANIERIGGRGLSLIRGFMDYVAYNFRGNEITMVKFTSTTNTHASASI